MKSFEIMLMMFLLEHVAIMVFAVKQKSTITLLYSLVKAVFCKMYHHAIVVKKMRKAGFINV